MLQKRKPGLETTVTLSQVSFSAVILSKVDSWLHTEKNLRVSHHVKAEKGSSKNIYPIDQVSHLRRQEAQYPMTVSFYMQLGNFM